jgi:hypothetical protein
MMKSVLMLSCIGVLAIAISSVTANGSTLLWHEQASSETGAVVTGPVLNTGVSYRIVAMNSWLYDNASNLAADAMYYTTNFTNNVYWGGNHSLCPLGHSFLQVSGQDVDWGEFSDGEYNHTYTRYTVGNGMAVTFQIHDWMDGNYTNNVCHIDIYVYLDVLVGGRVADWTGELVAYFAVSGAVLVGAVGVPAVKRFRALVG